MTLVLVNLYECATESLREIYLSVMQKNNIGMGEGGLS